MGSEDNAPSGVLEWCKDTLVHNTRMRTWRLRWRRVRWAWLDLRLSWIFGTIVLAAVLSWLIYSYVHDVTNVERFRGALFASWLAGLGLAVVVTVSFTIATIARPHQDVFEARARNLLRRQTGPHIDHIIPRIQKLLEPYCESAIREMTITEYDVQKKLFRVSQYTDNYLRSYLNDVSVSFKSQLVYRNGTAAPKGRDSCNLTFLRVDGEQKVDHKEFGDRIVYPFELDVHPHEVCRIEHRMVYWVQADTERNRHAPNRFTNNLKVIVHNELPNEEIILKIYEANTFLGDDDKEYLLEGKAANELPVKEIAIGAGTSLTAIELYDLEPRCFAYDFRLSVA